MVASRWKIPVSSSNDSGSTAEFKHLEILKLALLKELDVETRSCLEKYEGEDLGLDMTLY